MILKSASGEGAGRCPTSPFIEPAMKIGFSGRIGWASCGFLLKCHGVAETLQAMNQVSSQVVFVELVQIEITQFVVADLVGKHVIDGHQDLMGHRYRRSLIPPSSFESVKFVSQVSALSFGRCVGGL